MIENLNGESDENSESSIANNVLILLLDIFARLG